MAAPGIWPATGRAPGGNGDSSRTGTHRSAWRGDFSRVVSSGEVLLLWAIVGALGGGLAFRLADRLLEPDGDASMGWWPRYPRCGRAESLPRRLAMIALPLRLRCAGCGLEASRQQAGVELIGAAAITVIAWRYEDPIQAGIHALATLVLLTASLTDLQARLIPN